MAGGRGIGTTMVGTSGYMAPEQFRGWAQPASDLYGLGGTLLFLLSGALPPCVSCCRVRIRALLDQPCQAGTLSFRSIDGVTFCSIMTGVHVCVLS